MRLDRIVLSLMLAISLIAATGPSSEQPSPPRIADPFEVMSELDVLATQPLWPGFDPRSYPVAIYTGDTTLLFRHPSPPEEFVQDPERAEVFVFPGRYDAVRSNSNADIGGTMTATLLLTLRPGRPAREEASILVHESFHIFQREALRPDLRPNEVHRFTYPVADVENYGLSLEEDRALARAVESVNPEDAARWAALALELRADRLSRLALEHREFESGLEMMEGTAFYVAHLALGESRSTDKLLQTLPPEQFRWRPYATGGALAALLDRFAPGWKERLSRSRELTLEILISETLARAPVEPEQFSAAERAGTRCAAEAAIQALNALRDEHRSRLLSQESWRIEVTVPAGADTLIFQRFNPLSMMVLGNGELIHGDFLRVESPAGFLELQNPRAVRREIVGINALTTVGEGEHPLLGGVRSVIVAGFTEQPTVEHDGTLVTVVGEGLRLELRPAEVERRAKRLLVTVPPPSPPDTRTSTVEQVPEVMP